MKRSLLLSTVLMFVALGGFALEPALPAHARVGVLTLPSRYEGSGDNVTLSMRGYLREELKSSGYDAYVTGETYDDLHRHADGNADYYVEVVYVDHSGHPLVGLDTATRVGDLRVGGRFDLVRTAVNCEVRVYDGQSLELIGNYQLEQSHVRPMLTDVSLSSRTLPIYLAVSLLNRMQYRSAVKAVAHDAALKIVDAGRSGER